MIDDPKGHAADTPWRMPFAAWKAVALRTWRESSEDNVGIVAAGVAFYGFLALVPLLGSLVLSYGLFAAPETVLRDVRNLTSVMPADAAKLIGEQLMQVVHTSDGKKGLGVFVALALALFGARNGAGAVVTALNIAYEEQEKRGFVRLNLVTLAITGVAVVVALFASVAMAAMASLEALLPTVPDVVVMAGRVLSYVALWLVSAALAAALYRFGPSRRSARWVWLTPGSLLSAVGWLVLTVGFGFYVSSFGNYNATYGSLGAVVVLLTWLYLSSYILIFGAELNAELEHQTEQDTTAGTARPLGERAAWVADHVAEGPEAPTSAPPSISDTTPSPPPASSRLPARGLAAVAISTNGVFPALAATIGLRALRLRQSTFGLVLLAVAAGLAWRRGKTGEADDAL